MLLASMIGSIPVPLSALPDAVRELITGQTHTLAASLLSLRTARALVAFVTGGTLALAGLLMQALLRNPLADPYVLGVSAGAGVGALAALMCLASALVVDAAALAGATSIALLLYFLARRDLRSNQAADTGTSQLLLTGVILAALCGALITTMLSIAPDGRLRSMMFWMIGDLSGAPLRLAPCLVLVVTLLLAMRSARALNVLALHGDAAVALGVRVSAVRKGLFFGAALLTASAVSSAGAVGFVGLIIPHVCRFALGPDHRLLIPASVIAGGSFLVLCDTLARTIIAPQQLPVGAITAFIGAPVFLYQLHRLRK